MVDPISLTAAAMQNDIAQVNVVANNAANAMTPGFRRAFVISTSTVTAGGAAIGDLGAVQQQVRRDASPGAPRATGNPLDVAILGDGFLEVTTASGTAAYTRHGALALDGEGRLVAGSGHLPVAGIAGEIRLASPTPTIAPDGSVRDGNQLVGQIRVVAFDADVEMLPIRGGLFVPAGDAQPVSLSRPQILQGQIESSNVDSTREMVRLMEAFRHFETSGRVLQAYDDVREKAFRQLGQF